MAKRKMQGEHSLERTLAGIKAYIKKAISETPTATPVEFTATLTADGWTGDWPYEQAVTVEGYDTSLNVTVGIANDFTPEQYVYTARAKLIATPKEDGSILVTAYGESPPAVDVPITIQGVKI